MFCELPERTPPVIPDFANDLHFYDVLPSEYAGEMIQRKMAAQLDSDRGLALRGHHSQPATMAGERHRLRVWQSRQNRRLASNREFAKLAIRDFSGFVRRSEWSDELKSLLNDPRSMLARAAIVKDCHATTVGKVALADKHVFVKRYNYRGWAYALKNLFRSSRAKRVWRYGNSCCMRDIGVALPLAYLERRQLRVLRESYLITAAVTGDELSQVAARQRGNVQGKRLLIRQLAREVKWMHDRGIAHRDLKGENIIAQDLGNGRHRFFIVDFDGVVCRTVSQRVRVKNLARLARGCAVRVPLTATDHLRFVKDYLGGRDRLLCRKMYRDLLKVAGTYRAVDARALIGIIFYQGL
jgi:tRNA A-37 threonylcarbamoyl transferase component Bud32